MKKIAHLIYSWIQENKLLAGILAIAALLRFIGVYPGYPPTHPDETYIYGHALQMIKNLNIDPTRYDYPAFIPLIHAMLYMLIFNPVFIVYSFIFSPDNLPVFRNVLFFYQHVPLYNQQTAAIFWGRAITAAFSLGTVYLVFQVGKKYFNYYTGIAAALLTAVNFREVLNSHIGLPDVYNAFFLLLCFYFFKQLLESPNKKNYFLSGISLAFFFSTKSQVFPILTFFLVHLIAVWPKKIQGNLRALIRGLFKKDFIIAALISPIFYLIINVYQFIHWDKFYASNYYTTLQYRFGINNLDFYPISYMYHIGIGRIILMLIPVGLILGFWRFRLQTSLLSSVLIPFLIVFLYYSNGGFYIRNFVTVIPLLLIFASVAISEIFTVVSRILILNSKVTTLLIIVAVMVLSAQQIRDSFINTLSFTRPWAMTEARMWVERNVPNGETIAVRQFDKFSKGKNFKRVAFGMDNVFSLAEMQEERASYGYISLDELSNNFYWWMRTMSDESIKYWNKENADSISQNMYPAVASSELASWAVAAYIKPWQAPDSSFFIVRVPDVLSLGNKKLIAEFPFNDSRSLSSWSLVNGWDKDVKNINWDGNLGYDKKGSLRLVRSGAYPSVIRAVSPAISVVSNGNQIKAYEVAAWMKTGDSLAKKVRDGYIRVDFYENDPGKITLTTGSLYTALSSRVYGTSDWVEKRVTVVPPVNSKFMTVSLEMQGQGGTDIWADDVSIFESEKFFSDPRVQKPYLNYYKIPKNVLFPVSHGNL